ncbi:unnamed protein product [Prorocentrum cordatum]|uniref:RWD domain-containing protein n=1 Tax=Prorocentrum cordatum TaxID=2364126 RepID=A0ABN9X3S4_9DINO|nr:unnamed protein product [Polarella glacialis]
MYTSDGLELLKAAMESTGSRSVDGSVNASTSTTAEGVWWSYEVQSLSQRFGAALTRHVARPGGGALVDIDLSESLGAAWSSVALVALVPAGYPWRAKPTVTVVDRRGALARERLVQLSQCVVDALARAAAAGGPAVFFAAERAAAMLREMWNADALVAQHPAAAAAAAAAAWKAREVRSAQNWEGDGEDQATTAAPCTPERTTAAAFADRGQSPCGKKPWPATPPSWERPATWTPPTPAVPPFPLGRWSVPPHVSYSAGPAGVGSDVSTQQVDDGPPTSSHHGTTGTGSSTAASDSDSDSSGFSSDSSSDCEDLDDELQSVHRELQQNIRRQLIKNKRGGGAAPVPASAGRPRHGRPGRPTRA